MTCPFRHGGWAGTNCLVLCREGESRQKRVLATIGLRDKLLDGVVGGGATQPLTRLLAKGPLPGRPFRGENVVVPSGDAGFLCSVEGVY